MHADEHNRAMSEALGEDVYHYHLHVVYIPVVEKQILWSKRCKDEALRGTVKETITQVSRSKKWDSKPVLDEDGNPKLNEKGKKILRSSYSVLQDDFFNFMRAAGYTDVERGERGSTEEHLTVTQFKVQAEQQRLEAVTGQVAQAEQSLEDAKLSKIYDKYRVGEKRWGIPYETKAGKKVRRLTKFNEIDGKKCEDIEPKVITVVAKGRTTIDDRLKARVCELCGKTNIKLEIHHVNKVKNLKGKEPWEQVMIAKRRKTLAVCHDCHQKIHHGF